MNDLIEFVLARIADRERHAEMAATLDEHVWANLEARVLAPEGPDMPVGWLEHLRDSTPARALAKCAAEQRIVGRARMILGSWAAMHEGGDPSTAPYPDVSRRERQFAYKTLCDLAAADADHPAYQQEWSE